MTAPSLLAEQHAEKFAELALAHVRREYPNKLDHVMTSGSDVLGPRALHPVFYGSFDWHSCVHGYWLLARVYRRFPALPACDRIRELFNTQFTADSIAAEVAYAAHVSHAGFERPYGWAWLLELAAELARHDSEVSRQWSARLEPLAQIFAGRFMNFLPRATYAIRTGTHFNTAFAIVLAMDYAEMSGNDALASTLRSSAMRWYESDRGAQAWEPSGDDFLSSTLIEALCMQRVMPRAAFAAWMNSFLPDVGQRTPATLFEPAVVSDRTDGKIAHLDGLNLSRAWCWRAIASEWSDTDPRRVAALAAATVHLDASLPHIAGDYSGEHWLATYAVLALDGLG